MPNQSFLRNFDTKNISSAIHVPFAISGETLETADFTLIQIQDDQGRIGIGEGSPFPSLTGDNVHGVLPAVQEILTQLNGNTVLNSMQILRRNREEWFTNSPSAYVGVEMALWDLFGKQVNLPLAALWGQRMKEQVITDITLPIMPAAVVGDFWKIFANYGFKVIKIKVSGNLEADLDLVHTMMKLVPQGSQFTLDGNRGYELYGAVQLVQRLRRSGHQPLFFEQPLASDDWDGLKRVEQEGEVPVCLDETVITPEDAIRVVQEKTASMINLKIMKSGIDETRKIIAIARSAGIALMIGGMLESEIAMCTSLQLACGTGWISHFDLDTPFFFKEHVTVTSPWHRKSAELVRPNMPGIGIELLNQYILRN